jgi:hypothetical protein
MAPTLDVTFWFLSASKREEGTAPSEVTTVTSEPERT